MIQLFNFREWPRRYVYCRFWNQSIAHALIHMAFLPNHYKNTRKDWQEYDHLKATGQLKPATDFFSEEELEGNNMPTEFTEADAGCFIEGSWGHYGMARLIQIAGDNDYGKGSYAHQNHIKLANKYMRLSHIFTEDEMDHLVAAADEAEQFMNECAPEGYSFGWHDGEFFLWSDEDWQEV